jgi:RimJ/RimL family protein N-acetyltransferase
VDNLASARLLARLGFTARGEAAGEMEYVRKVGGEPAPSPGKVALSKRTRPHPP